MQDNQRQTLLYAYIAGILDADGCFMITKHTRKTPENRRFMSKDKRSPTYMPTVKIAMIEIEAISLLTHELKFGNYHQEGVRKNRPNSKPIFQWYLRGAQNVAPFLRKVLPYLRVKKERAQFLLEFCENVSNKNVGYRGVSETELYYREESYRKIREFNGNKVAATTEPLRLERVSDSLNS